MSFDLQVTITDDRLFDLLTCGFEGGVGYWCLIADYENPDNENVRFTHSQLPLTKNGAVVCQCADDHTTLDDEGFLINTSGERLPLLKLDREACQRGLQIMLHKYPEHFANFLGRREDAETGDVFIQCSLLGKITYG